jgi:hypothetical protein
MRLENLCFKSLFTNAPVGFIGLIYLNPEVKPQLLEIAETGHCNLKSKNKNRLNAPLTENRINKFFSALY